MPPSNSPADSLAIKNGESPQGARVLTDEQSRLIPTGANVGSQLTQAELGGKVSEKVVFFIETLLWFAEEVMLGQIQQSRLSGLF